MRVTTTKCANVFAFGNARYAGGNLARGEAHKKGMMLLVFSIIVIALFIEAVVGALKPLWKADGTPMTVTEMVSIGIGILIAVLTKMDIVSYACDYSVWDMPEWAHYILYVMTGIGVGRGPSFVYDLWKSMMKWKDIDFTAILKQITPVPVAALEAEAVDVDLEISHWSVAQLRQFCELNHIPTVGCVTKQDYMEAIEMGGSLKPPTEE